MTNWQNWFSQSVKEHGDSLTSSHYDSPRSFYVRQQVVLECLGDMAGKLILDVGPGTGHMAHPLTRKNQVIGVDFVRTMLVYAAGKDEKPVQADAVRLPVASQSMDAIICIGVLQHIDDSTAFLKELLRVKKPDGILLLGTLNQDSWIRRTYHLFFSADAPMHTYRIPELAAQFQKLVSDHSVTIRTATLYYPLPGYRWVGTQPFVSRFLSSAFIMQVI